MTSDTHDSPGRRPVPATGQVTVIMCVYNAGEYFKPALDSVLQQTYRDLQIIIVDDGSTDGCTSILELVSDPRVVILRHANRGRPASLNRALAIATGEFYTVQDADDISHPARIARLVETMRRYPDIAAAMSGHDLIIEGRRMAPRFAAKDPRSCRLDIAALRMPGHDATAMYRMSMVGHYRYDETLPFIEAYDYVMRVGEEFSMRVVGGCLYSYRVHWNSITRRDPSQRCLKVRECAARILQRREIAFSPSMLPAVPQPGRASNRDRDNDLVSHFMESLVDLRHAGRRVEALRTAAQCIALHPLDPYYYKPAIYALAPRAAIDWYRAKRARRNPVVRARAPA
jgi:glycosyltransferase involved in cell wall biosynthesis